MQATISQNIPQTKLNKDNWYDWKWQQRNTFKDEKSLREACGGWDDEISINISNNLQSRKIQITPYYLQLILDSITTGTKITDNPLWKQAVPFWPEEAEGGYDEITENWELAAEMKTPICQHKYDNRVILRMSNTCNAYCQFCFEALRTLKTDAQKSTASRNLFKESLEYIRQAEGLEEVILSGGDPLMLSDEKLEYYLSELRSINTNLLIRIHSRALTFNPYRITDKLLAIMKKYRVNSFGVHVCHPSELSMDFHSAVERIQKVVPIVFSNMPLLRGINDDEKILHQLFMQLYRLGIKPYYLYHYMPFSPGSSVYKNSVKEGVDIMRKLKRKVSNIAMPEYVLPHSKGKFTVPLITNDAEHPKVETNKKGMRFYTFTNWQGEKCYWYDDN